VRFTSRRRVGGKEEKFMINCQSVSRGALIAAGLAAGTVAAQSPVPRYEVHRAPAAIAVDGQLDDAAWSAAAPAVSLQFLWEDQTGAKQPTSVRLLWDADALYIGFEADDADLTARFMNRDDPTYRDDALEIFINPNPAQVTVYYGFETNALGTLYDYLNYQTRTFFKRFDATDLQIGIALDGTLNEREDVDRGWSLELAIPWENFEELARRRPAIGAIWTANLNRWDGVEPERRMSIWSDPQNDESWPHVPERFGELVFVE
jgi:hypothetical protein